MRDTKEGQSVPLVYTVPPEITQAIEDVARALREVNDAIDRLNAVLKRAT